MIQNDTKHQANGLPGLMELPILGPLFKSNDYINQQTELMVLVTPYIVHAVAQKDLSRPDDGFADPSDPAQVLLGRSIAFTELAAFPIRPTITAASTVSSWTDRGARRRRCKLSGQRWRTGRRARGARGPRRRRRRVRDLCLRLRHRRSAGQPPFRMFQPITACATRSRSAKPTTRSKSSSVPTAASSTPPSAPRCWNSRRPGGARPPAAS